MSGNGIIQRHSYNVNSCDIRGPSKSASLKYLDKVWRSHQIFEIYINFKLQNIWHVYNGMLTYECKIIHYNFKYCNQQPIPRTVQSHSHTSANMTLAVEETVSTDH